MNENDRERRRGLVRFTLGQLQMLGATIGFFSLLINGVSSLTILVLSVTGLITLTSIILFQWVWRKKS